MISFSHVQYRKWTHMNVVSVLQCCMSSSKLVSRTYHSEKTASPGTHIDHPGCLVNIKKHKPPQYMG